MGNPRLAAFLADRDLACNAVAVLQNHGLQAESILASVDDRVEGEFERLICMSPEGGSVSLSFQPHRDPIQTGIIVLANFNVTPENKSLAEHIRSILTGSA